jgi:GDP-L-fucose synthase
MTTTAPPPERRYRRVLVTGGTGFLGRVLLQTASRHGYEVIAPSHAAFDLVTGEDLDAFMREVTRTAPIDAVIHSAAHYGGIGMNQEQPATIFERNGRMTLNVLELARRFEVRKVLPIGSACAYPGYLDVPLREESFWDGRLHESVEAYGFSKKLQLVGQNAYYRQYGIEGNHLALANLYGPYDVFAPDRSHALAALVRKFVEADGDLVLWGDGSPVREFLHVEDAAEAVVRALELPHDLEPINVGTGVGTSIRDLATLVAQHVGFRGTLTWDETRPNGSAYKVLDVTRMTEVLRWTPHYDLEHGLKHTIDWYREHRHAAGLR